VTAPTPDPVAAALERSPYSTATDLARATNLPRAQVLAALARLVAEERVRRSLSAAKGWLVETWALVR
jgi:DNA-binding IclR family transcriptional regulator